MRHMVLWTAMFLAACGGASAEGGTAGGGAGGGASGPSVTIEAGRVTAGPADYEPTASAFVRDHVAEIRSCYERELARDATLAGRVDVDFTVGTSGGVSEVQARTRGNLDAATASCVTGVVSPAAFAPVPAAPATVSYTLLFAR